MQIKPQDLVQHLRKNLASIYVLSGDEPLQVEEALDNIRMHAKAQGFEEKLRFDAGTGFDWESLRQSANSLSLFAERRILDLRLPTGKPGDKGAKVLAQYADDPSPDNLLIVSAPKLDPPSKRSAWYKALDKAGACVQFWPIDSARLPTWIRQRARNANLQIYEPAARLLAERVEGNLLACAQEIEKLSLLYPAGVVDLDAVMKSVGDSARYNVFDCVDAALAGQTARVVRIVHGLRDDGTEPILVSWAITREVRTLEAISTERDRGGDIGQLLDQHRIWDKRKRQAAAALQRLSTRHLREMLEVSARIDRIMKGAEFGNTWDELMYLASRLSGVLIRPA